MIRESFCFLPRVGAGKESQIWQSGVTDWNSFLDAQKVPGFSVQTKQTCDSLLHTAREQLLAENANWFGAMLDTQDHWRLYNTFKDDAVFLDIETDGYYGSVTMVGMYDGRETKTFVRGANLDRTLLAEQLAKHKMIVTFKGKTFDLPILKKYFNLTMPLLHVDLRFVCQKAGLTGGLKQIEKDLGIHRSSEVDGMQGIDAVYLWQQFKQTKNNKYLELLIQYNEEDVINLPAIASKVIPPLWTKTRKNFTSEL